MVGLYVLADGRLVSVGTAPADVPAGHAVRALPAGAVYGVTHDWDASTADWVAKGPTLRYVLSRLEFRWRYTLAEQLGIELAERTHETATVRATLAVLRQSLAESTEIDVRDPRTVQGVQYHASIGLIATDRVTQILAPVVTP